MRAKDVWECQCLLFSKGKCWCCEVTHNIKKLRRLCPEYQVEATESLISVDVGSHIPEVKEAVFDPCPKKNEDRDWW